MAKDCNDCGTELPDHANYCLNCGKKQDAVPLIKHDACGACQCRTADKNCTKCGKSVCEVCMRKCGQCKKILCPDCFEDHKCGEGQEKKEGWKL